MVPPSQATLPPESKEGRSSHPPGKRASRLLEPFPADPNVPILLEDVQHLPFPLPPSSILPHHTHEIPMIPLHRITPIGPPKMHKDMPAPYIAVCRIVEIQLRETVPASAEIDTEVGVGGRVERVALCQRKKGGQLGKAKGGGVDIYLPFLR